MQVASDIVRSIVGGKHKRYISTGSDVTMYNILGYMQCWLCPGSISSLLQDKFGLKKLKAILADEALKPTH